MPREQSHLRDLPDGWKVLVDAPADRCAEEWCWAPVAFADTEAKAIELVHAEEVAVDATLTAHGKEWWRRDPAYTPTAHGTWRNEREDITVDYEPWSECSKSAMTGIEVWRIEVSYDA